MEAVEMDKFNNASLRPGKLAKGMVVLGSTITMIAILSLVSCGWLAVPRSTPIPLSAQLESPGGGGLDQNAPAVGLMSPGGGSPGPVINVTLVADYPSAGEVEFLATWHSGTSPYTIAWDFGGGATNNRIIHQQNVLTLEFDINRIQLLAHRLLAQVLTRHYKSTTNVAILDESLTILDA